MIRNLSKHEIEEITNGYQWTQWQVAQLKALEDYKRRNKDKLSKEYQTINQNIRLALQNSYKDGATKQERQILQAIKRGYKGVGTNAPANTGNVTTSGEFFKTNDRKLDALIKATTHDMTKAETATLRMANDQYRKITFNAQVYANTGAGTYKQAVDMATKDFLQAGINSIQYKNGRRVNIKSYAEMAIRTANKRAYLQGEGEMRKEWGISTVIINKRGNPCPLCAEWVGKVLIDDVWSGGSDDGVSGITGIKYPLLSEAMAGGLYHPNCKDSHTTYFEGISTPPDESEYTKEELDELVNQYNVEQKQNYAEHQAEKYERLAKYSFDEENQKKYAQKASAWRSTLENLSKINNKPVANSVESGISGKKSLSNQTNTVDIEYILSKEYHNKFKKITNDNKINEQLYSQSKAMLIHRNGTDKEDMCLIDSRTGKIIGHQTNSRSDFGVDYNNSLTNAIKNSPCNTLISIHNHPTNNPPTGSDIVSNGSNGYKLGVVVTHNGKVFIYKAGKTPFTASSFGKNVDKYRSSGYNLSEYDAIIKTLEEYQKQYDIYWREIV